MFRTWTALFLREMLKQIGLYYVGDDEMLMHDAAKHHGPLLLRAEAYAKLVTDKLAHDAVFKEIPKS